MQKSAREWFHTKLRRGAGFDKECNFNAIFIWLFLPQRFHNLFWWISTDDIKEYFVSHNSSLTLLRYLWMITCELKNKLKWKEIVLKWFFDAIGISSLNTFCNQKIVQVRLCSCSFNRMTDNFISSEWAVQSGTKVRVFSQNL